MEDASAYANQGSEYPPIAARLRSPPRQWEAVGRLGLDLYPPAARACYCHCSCGRRARRAERCGARPRLQLWPTVRLPLWASERPSAASSSLRASPARPPALSPCLAEGNREARLGPRRSRAPRGPACSFPWAECTGFCGKATTRSGWAPERRSTWPPSSSICRPRSWNWRATRRGTTRRRGSSRGTCSWPSATTRSSTSCWEG